MRKFHNPYNFVPAPRRKDQHETLGDRQPVGHDSYKAGCWSGRIAVTLTTETPLLALDASSAKRDSPVQGHHIFSTRVGPDGLPYLPPTSIKGMLRSAYEIVTNSRLSILEKHDQRLAYRSPASEGLRMVPARVVGNRIDLFFGTNNPTTQVFDNGGPKKTNLSDERDQRRRNSVMHAAWIERHPDIGDLSQLHLKRVWAYITLWRHEHPDFDFWNVVEIRHEDDPNPRTPLVEQRDNFGKSFMLEPADPSRNLSAYPGYQPGRWVQGYICVTGKNIDRKHDERLFFGNPVALTPSSLQMQALRAGWRLLIEDYESTFRKNGLVDPDIEASRHILNAEQEKGLPDGTLCYASVQGNGRGGWQVRGLFPVMISRRMHDLSPIELLPPSLRPAMRLFDDGPSRRSEMSPADRVFGWIGQQGEGAYRGQLRVGVAKCLRDDAIEEFRDASQETTSVPLAILSQPKPQQVRFYAAKSDNGAAVPNGAEDRGAIGYKSNNGLRGRKVFPHHANLPPEHWKDPQNERTQLQADGHFQEYRRPNKFHPNAAGEAHQDGTKSYWKLTDEPTRDDQNRSIKNWIKPQTKFSFDIDVTNLSRVELGALIWLLDLERNESAQTDRPRSFFHRLGGGKPLGFGSVKLAVDWENTRLREGEQWRDYYLSLNETFDQPPNDVPKTLQSCVVDFQDAISAAYGESKGFSKVSFIEAFLRGAEGFTDGYPIHYPRTRPRFWLDETDPVPPHPEGKSYEWFVANERTGKDGGDKLALPDLATDGGLRIYRSRD